MAGIRGRAEPPYPLAGTNFRSTSTHRPGTSALRTVRLKTARGGASSSRFSQVVQKAIPMGR